MGTYSTSQADWWKERMTNTTNQKRVFVALVQHTDREGERRIVFGPISDSIWDWRLRNFVQKADTIHSGNKPINWSNDKGNQLMTDGENYFFFVNNSDLKGEIRTFGFARIPRDKIGHKDMRVPWIKIKTWSTFVKPEIVDFWNIDMILKDFDGIF